MTHTVTDTAMMTQIDPRVTGAFVDGELTFFAQGNDMETERYLTHQVIAKIDPKARLVGRIVGGEGRVVLDFLSTAPAVTADSSTTFAYTLIIARMNGDVDTPTFPRGTSFRDAVEYVDGFDGENNHKGLTLIDDNATVVYTVPGTFDSRD